MTTRPSGYPLQLAGTFAPRLDRGPWLVKWLLAIPHCIALFFLWIAFAVVINRAKVHQLPALSATTGDLT